MNDGFWRDDLEAIRMLGMIEDENRPDASVVFGEGTYDTMLRDYYRGREWITFSGIWRWPAPFVGTLVTHFRGAKPPGVLEGVWIDRLSETGWRATLHFYNCTPYTIGLLREAEMPEGGELVIYADEERGDDDHDGAAGDDAGRI